MHRDSQALQEYILSVCLHNQTALQKCMMNLTSARDFTGQNRKAFAVMEAQFTQNGQIDPLVLSERWVNAGIYDGSTARYILNAYNGDTDFELKMEEVKEHGIFRRIHLDLEEIHRLTKSDITADLVSQKAVEMVSRWGLGTSKKYMTTAEVEREEELGLSGAPLRQGIPLLDDKVYKLAGQRKGTIKATIFREKNGKTRHACWEVAQDLRQGHKVLYVTLEGGSSDIKDNVREVLQDEFDGLKTNLFHKQGTTDVYEIAAAITEIHFNEKVDKVVIDHMQRISHPDGRRLSENESGNRCTKILTDLAVKYDLNMHLINQAKQPDVFAKGYKNTPSTYDCYGSNQLIKDASIILVGFRPNTVEDLIINSPLGAKVMGPDGGPVPYHSVFVKPILSRKKMPYLHRWMHFVDTDMGYRIQRLELI